MTSVRLEGIAMVWTSPLSHKSPDSSWHDLAMHRRFMAEASKEAETSFSQGGIPVGSILMRNGQIVGRGHNQRVQLGSSILHGEMDCLTNAGRQTTYRDTVLYTTLSPCMMCSGTIVQFSIPCVVVGDNINFGGNEGFLLRHNVDVIVLNEERCIDLMRTFIDEHKDIWSEDIGLSHTGHIS